MIRPMHAGFLLVGCGSRGEVVFGAVPWDV